MNGKLEGAFKTDHYPIIDIKMSDDSRFIGSVSSDSLLTVASITGENIFAVKVRYNQLNTKQIFRFTKENNVLALSGGHDAVLLDPDGRIIQTFDLHKDSVNDFIATASSDNTIIIWYYNSVEKKYDYYNILKWHNDTVWSVSFSNRNINVLSASADSTIKVGNINNEVIYPGYFPKDQKYCYSEFSKTNKAIIAINYNKQNKELNKTFLVSDFGNPTFNPWIDDGTLLHGISGYKFNSLVFSPNENYFIYEQKGKTFLADARLVFESDISSISNLMELDGLKHFFTSDEKYILAIDGNTFKYYFVDVEGIYNLTRQQKE